MIFHQFYRVMINPSSKEKLKDSTAKKINEKLMYPPFMNDKFFYSDDHDPDIGNKLMKRQHTELML